MKKTVLAVLAVLAFSSCTPPKYVGYVSVFKDWKAGVPWGWQVITDREGDHFASTNLIGPFEPLFYLGAPSLSVRWYKYASAHRLADGLLERFDSVDDFSQQMLAHVYGPDYQLKKVLNDNSLAAQGIVDGKTKQGLSVKQFVVLSPVPVPKSTKWGTVVEREGGRVTNLRLHAYTLIPMKTGFYVLVYPATRDGFKIYEGHYNQLVNSFRPLTEGPNGPKVEADGKASASAPAPGPKR